MSLKILIPIYLETRKSLAQRQGNEQKALLISNIIKKRNMFYLYTATGILAVGQIIYNKLFHSEDEYNLNKKI